MCILIDLLRVNVVNDCLCRNIYQTTCLNVLTTTAVWYLPLVVVFKQLFFFVWSYFNKIFNRQYCFYYKPSRLDFLVRYFWKVSLMWMFCKNSYNAILVIVGNTTNQTKHEVLYWLDSLENRIYKSTSYIIRELVIKI